MPSMLKIPLYWFEMQIKYYVFLYIRKNQLHIALFDIQAMIYFAFYHLGWLLLWMWYFHADVNQYCGARTYHIYRGRCFTIFINLQAMGKGVQEVLLEIKHYFGRNNKVSIIKQITKSMRIILRNKIPALCNRI